MSIFRTIIHESRGHGASQLSLDMQTTFPTYKSRLSDARSNAPHQHSHHPDRSRTFFGLQHVVIIQAPAKPETSRWRVHEQRLAEVKTSFTKQKPIVISGHLWLIARKSYWVWEKVGLRRLPCFLFALFVGICQAVVVNISRTGQHDFLQICWMQRPPYSTKWSN